MTAKCSEYSQADQDTADTSTHIELSFGTTRPRQGHDSIVMASDTSTVLESAKNSKIVLLSRAQRNITKFFASTQAGHKTVSKASNDCQKKISPSKQVG